MASTVLFYSLKYITSYCIFCKICYHLRVRNILGARVAFVSNLLACHIVIFDHKIKMYGAGVSSICLISTPNLLKICEKFQSWYNQVWWKFVKRFKGLSAVYILTYLYLVDYKSWNATDTFFMVISNSEIYFPLLALKGTKLYQKKKKTLPKLQWWFVCMNTLVTLYSHYIYNLTHKVFYFYLYFICQLKCYPQHENWNLWLFLKKLQQLGNKTVTPLLRWSITLTSVLR
jgi:hypothetical protein